MQVKKVFSKRVAYELIRKEHDLIGMEGIGGTFYDKSTY